MNLINSIDLTTFNDLKETMGADFIGELIGTYNEETPKLITSLKEALSKKDFEGFRRAAHSIKSTSNSMGALRLGELAKELEFMGRDGNLSGAEGKVEILVTSFQDVKQNLEDLSHA